MTPCRVKTLQPSETNPTEPCLPLQLLKLPCSLAQSRRNYSKMMTKILANQGPNNTEGDPEAVRGFSRSSYQKFLMWPRLSFVSNMDMMSS